MNECDGIDVIYAAGKSRMSDHVTLRQELIYKEQRNITNCHASKKSKCLTKMEKRRHLKISRRDKYIKKSR